MALRVEMAPLGGARVADATSLPSMTSLAPRAITIRHELIVFFCYFDFLIFFCYFDFLIFFCYFDFFFVILNL